MPNFLSGKNLALEKCLDKHVGWKLNPWGPGPRGNWRRAKLRPGECARESKKQGRLGEQKPVGNTQNSWLVPWVLLEWRGLAHFTQNSERELISAPHLTSRYLVCSKCSAVTDSIASTTRKKSVIFSFLFFFTPSWNLPSWSPLLIVTPLESSRLSQLWLSPAVSGVWRKALASSVEANSSDRSCVPDIVSVLNLLPRLSRLF